MRDRRLLGVLIIVAVVILVSVFRPHPDSEVRQTRRIVRTTPTEQEQKAFWAEHMDSFSMQLLTSNYHIPEIRDRYAFLAAVVRQRYGALNINRITIYNPESHSILAGNSTSNGTADLEIYIPRQMELWESFRESGNPDWRTQFELSVVVSFMHEMEHFLQSSEESARSTTREGLIANEKAAWARTCEYSIAPLVEKYDLSISPSDRAYYAGWVVAGRDESSPIWEEFIRDAYEHLRDD